MRIDHVGIATDDARSLMTLFESLLDVIPVHEETVNGMSIGFLDCGNGYLEVIEPLEDGPIARYLDSHGAGIHHVAFETDSVAGALERARNAGIELIDEEPRSGAWGHTIGFLHPKDTGGVLIEFVEHETASH